jgi:glycosyltransferase involved in cell wall biosynthesis
VVTPSGALAELIAHQEDGFVCRDDSVEALAEGLEFFLRDEERLAAAGRRARESSRRYTRERIGAEWLEVFRLPAPGLARPADAARTVVHSHGR